MAVPRGDLCGPGTRIPTLIAAPWAQPGVVDPPEYDTASILGFITRRWGLDTVPGLAQRDAALAPKAASPWEI